MPAALIPERNCVLVSSSEVPRQSSEDQMLNGDINWDGCTSFDFLSHGDPTVIEADPTGELFSQNHSFTSPVSVITSVNGYWKQERFFTNRPPITAAIIEPSLCLTLSSDSGNEELMRKPQLFLAVRSPSGSDKEPEEKQSTVAKRTGIGDHGRFSRIKLSMRGGHVPSSNAKNPLTAFIKQRNKRSKLYRRRRDKTLVAKDRLVDLRKPWSVGELLWAHPGSPDPLPWWPAIVIQRPRKVMSVTEASRNHSGSDENAPVPVFLVCLLGPLKSFNLRRLPQTRLRLFSGRKEFDSFLRDSVLQAENKIKALRQFVIQPTLQSAWQVACDQAEAAREAEPGAAGRLALFPWATEAMFRQLFGAPLCLQPRKEKVCLSSNCDWHDKKYSWNCGHISPSELSSDDSCSDSDHSQTDIGRSRKSKTNKDEKRTLETINDMKKSCGSTLKNLVTRFEFEKLQFVHVTPRRVFVCSSCGMPGEHVPANGTNGVSGVRSDAAVSKTKHVIDNGFGPSVAQHTVDVRYPDIQQCSGSCGNYIHPGCAKSVDLPVVHKQRTTVNPDDTGHSSGSVNICEVSSHSLPDCTDESPSSQKVYACNLCLSHLRQCFICNQTQTCSQIFSGPILTSSGTLSSTTAAAAASVTACSTNFSSDSSPPISVDHKELCAVEDEKLNAGLMQDQMIRCSVKMCSRWYHPSCLRKSPFSTAVRDRRAGAFSCPAHTCLACAVETPGTLPRPTPRYIRCFLCPAAYHPGEWCLPAGSKKIAHNWIICPRHALDGGSFQDVPRPLRIPIPSSTLTTMFQPTNVSWCFICSKGGRIICCEMCPASFHEECLKLDEVPDKFICEDCASGRFPRYGEIVWSRLPPNLNAYHNRGVKYLDPPVDIDSARDQVAHQVDEYASLTAGVYWWPGEIVHPERLFRPESEFGTQSGSFSFEVVDEISQQIVRQSEYPLGLFPVRLFGLTATSSNDCALPVIVWSTRARLFPYEEGDDKRSADTSVDSTGDDEDEPRGDRQRGRSSYHDDGEDEDPLLQLGKEIDEDQSIPDNEGDLRNCMSSPLSNLRSKSTRTRQRFSSQKPVDNVQRKCKQDTIINPALLEKRKEVYNTAVKEAAIGWHERREKFSQLLGRTRRPDYYKPIKVNWPLGSVRIYRLTDPSEAPRCECVPHADIEPCGPSSNCINRELHYECSPGACPNGEACQNQRFTKRLYPAQRPFWTGEERGWGLKTLVSINSGDFVNEYIGELIDEEEANRRLRFAHENNVTNYYMMKLDSQRIIDAGPKGNLSRFMNHSCNPNLNTQKWTVNGDNRIGLFAVRDIAAGEELTFDYNFVALGQERLNCRCGASNCTGFLGSSSSSITQSGTGGHHTNQRSTEDRLESNKQTVLEGASKTIASSGLLLRGTAPNENALSKKERHECTCFRCGSTHPPPRVGFDSTQTAVSNEHRSWESERPYVSGKRRLERELKDLFSDSNCHSSTVEKSPYTTKHPCFPRPEMDGSKRPTRDLTCASSLVESPLLFCTKSDCGKAYHLSCLDLESPPSGRWYCPWHHCDACGRPAHVFCGLCPSSFCLAHVEGSITVLPPLPNKRASRMAGPRVGNSKSIKQVDLAEFMQE
ncbi:Histone-lysine N-methyltransferase [Fasciola gigantica]|uniref:Histone-lysine N-methyltransferase n=1 Tax=Fasciola gigantica TaxID=46835 RepID=A0A504Z2V2_FASGI|nr:Histone-lysine N-methyltransferase [Fasciola gigantica]